MISVSTRERCGVPGGIRTPDARFVASHDVHFNTGTDGEPSAGIEPASPPYRRGALPLSDDGIALAGFEPASIHAKRPLGKRASHSQPPGHETVHPQPLSQPTPSCRGSRSWAPLSRFRLHVFPVSFHLLYRAVEVAGVEPADLCLQGSDPFRRRPRASLVRQERIERPAPPRRGGALPLSDSRSRAPLRNRTGSFRASTGRADHLRKRGLALAVGIEPTWFRWTDGSPHQRRRRAWRGERGMGNGEWETGNGKRKMGNGKWGTENGERNGKWETENGKRKMGNEKRETENGE